MKRITNLSSLNILFAISLMACVNAIGQIQAPWNKTGYGLYIGEFSSICSSGTNILVSTTTDGIFKSGDNGATWQASNNGLITLNVNALATVGTNTFACTAKGLFVSTDNGSSWTSSGLQNEYLYTMASLGSTLFTSSPSGIFTSADGGVTWTNVSPLVPISFGSIGTDIICSDNKSNFYKSSDSGVSWSNVSTINNGFLYGMVVNGTTVLASTNLGVYRSVDGGQSWSGVSLANPYNYYTSLEVINGNVYMAGSDILRSTDDGQTFIQVSTNGGDFNKLALISGTIYGVGFASYFTSSDDGLTWTKPAYVTGLLGQPISAVVVNGSTILVSNGNTLFRSTDSGSTWALTGNLPTNCSSTSLRNIGSTFFISGYGIGVYKSQDGGTTWTLANTGINSTDVLELETSGTTLVAATSNEIYISTDQGTSWSLSTSLGGYVNPSVSVSANVFYAVSYNNQVIKSTDGGMSWTTLARPPDFVLNVALAGGNLYVGTYSGVYFSADGGGSWTKLSTQLDNNIIRSMTSDGTTLIFSTDDSKIFSCSGNSLNQIFGDYRSTYAFAFSGSTLYTGRNTLGYASLWNVDLSGILSISSFTPDTGKFGSTVTIKGTNFNPNPAKNIVVIGELANVLSATSTTLQVAVPSFAGSKPITIKANGQAVTSLNTFSIIPEIASFSPTSGVTGTAVTISGYGFDKSLYNQEVYFNGQPSQSYTPAYITINSLVPDNATTGPISIIYNGKTFSSQASFHVLPNITSFGPKEGAAGTQVSILGTGFDSNAAHNIVKFNGTVASVSGAYYNELTVVVPDGATSGDISVEVDGGLAITATPFIIDPLAVECFSYPPQPSIRASQNGSELILTSSSRGGNHWYKNGQLMVGAVDSILVVIESGSYEVQVNIQGCPSPMSNAVVVTITGDIANSLPVNVYPNPFNKQLILDLKGLSGQQIVQVELLSTIGVPVMKSSFAGGTEWQLDLPTLSNGLYIMRINDGTQIIERKLLKF